MANKNRNWNRNKNQRGNSKGYTADREEQEEEPRNNGIGTKDKTKKLKNHPSWYSKSPELLRDAASIPFSWSAGLKVDLNSKLNTVNPGDENLLPQGSLCCLKMAPSLGRSTGLSDPINVAGNAMYTWVRHLNSGARNYDMPDLVLYVMACANIYQYIYWLTRIYGTAFTYAQQNRNLPTGIFECEGIDYDSIKNNLANFRAGINLLIAKASSLSVPNVFPLIDRMVFLYQGYFTEGTSLKDQIYFYSPDGFYRMALDADGAGKLHYDREFKFGSSHTAEDLIAYGESMLNDMIYSEDMQIMSGDILKAYGIGNTHKLSMLPEAYMVLPQFSIAELEQIKNAYNIPGEILTNANDIRQDATKKFLISNISKLLRPLQGETAVTDTKTQNLTETAVLKKVLTTSTADTSPELVMENTRVMPAVTALQVNDPTVGRFLLLSTGSDFVVDIVYYGMNSGETTPAPRKQAVGYATTGPNTFEVLYQQDDVATEVYAFASLFEIRNNFKFAPPVPMYGDAAGGNGHWWLQDLDNFAIIDPDIADRMHQVAIMSELALDSINKI